MDGMNRVALIIQYRFCQRGFCQS